MLVERVVDGGGPDGHVGMQAAQALETLGGAEQADQADLLGAGFLQPVDGRHRGVAGGDDGRDHDHQPLGEVGRAP